MRLTEQERIFRAQAKRERQAQRRHDPSSYVELERRWRQAQAVRALFGCRNRHEASWDLEHEDRPYWGGWGSTWDYELEAQQENEACAWIEFVCKHFDPDCNAMVLADHGVVQII